jgi:RND family efflux transporter MFP subunit
MRILSFLIIILLSCSSAWSAEFSVSGIIRSCEDVVVRPRKNGIVSRIKVKEGEEVKKGQLLIELESLREKAMLDVVHARIESTKASLAQRKIALESSMKAQARNEMMQEVIAHKDLDESKDLVRRNKADVSFGEGNLKEMEAELQLRQVELDEALLVAPFSGKVTKIHVSEGETVRALDTPVCELHNMEKFYVQLSIPLQYIQQVNLSDKVTVEIEKDIGLLNEELPATVFYKNPVIDSASRTFQTKILVSQKKQAIQPGMTALVHFITD